MKTVLYQYLMPIKVILFSVPFLKESLTAGQAAGALVVCVGIFLARSAARFINEGLSFYSGNENFQGSLFTGP